jgi:glycosyltransferase involved in cell wall biosynthesis
MRCPTLKELPTPPAAKTGWPWTEESPQLPNRMPDGRLWPKISIITPSLNQGQFIEETIRSVLLQGYPDLEYIIIDGGSRDRSVYLIEEYGQWLAYWISQPDSGQSNAINKGLKLSSGDIVAWINSDDVYHPGSFSAVASSLHHGGKVTDTILFANCDFIDEAGIYLYRYIPEPFSRNKLMMYWKEYFIPQPTVFIPGSVFRANPLNEVLSYVMDWELWLRLSERYEYKYIDRTLAKFRNHGASKWGTAHHLFIKEQQQIVNFHHKTLIDKLHFHFRHVAWKSRMFYHRMIRIYLLKLLYDLTSERFYSALRRFKKKRFAILGKRR